MIQEAESHDPGGGVASTWCESHDPGTHQKAVFLEYKSHDPGKVTPPLTINPTLCTSIHNRKNALFAGADSGGKHWAMVATLIPTAKLNNVEPLAWLTDVLKRIVSGQTKRNKLDTLLPWNWKQQSDVAPVNSG